MKSLSVNLLVCCLKVNSSTDPIFMKCKKKKSKQPRCIPVPSSLTKIQFSKSPRGSTAHDFYTSLLIVWCCDSTPPIIEALILGADWWPFVTTQFLVSYQLTTDSLHCIFNIYFSNQEPPLLFIQMKKEPFSANHLFRFV